MDGYGIDLISSLKVTDTWALSADRDMDEIINGEQVEDIVVYINRLQVAKRRADQRIAALGGLDSFKVRGFFILKPRH